MSIRVVSLGLLFVGLGCGGKVGEGVRPKDFTGTGATGMAVPSCSGSPKYVQPLLVDVDPDARLRLETSMKKGVVVVSYDCTNLKVLPNCHLADGDYEYAGASKRELVVQMKNQDDLSVNLPLSSGKLGGEISSGRSIDLALVSIGLRSTTVEKLTKKELTGDGCDGATHFVQSATIGAFSMATGSAGQVKAAAEIFAIGASGQSQSSRTAGATDGTIEGCKKADSDAPNPPSDCKAPIRLELQPITGEAPAAAAVAAGEAAKQEKKEAEPQRNPCPEGYAFANSICTKTAQGPKLCDPKDTADCKAQCDKGSFESCYNYGIKAKGEDAIAYLKKACDNGHGEACGEQAYRVYDIKSGPKNEAAFKLGQKGCDAGGANACATLGDMLVGWLTLGDVVDAARGIKAYDRGCALGSAEACGSLGDLMIQGTSMPKDEKKGVQLLDRACAGGSAGSCHTLAMKISSSNPDRAFRAAAKVCEVLKGISCDEMVQVTADVGHPKEALAMSEKACSAWPYNCGKLGDLYRDGVGGLKDAKKATEAWKKACEGGKGSRTACERLGKKSR